MHITPQFSEGTNHTILGLVGDTSNLDEDMICALDIVESVKRIAEPYKKANRKFEGVKISSYSDIPVTRGLGRSSAGIILGLVGANHILGDKFSKS